MYFACIYQILLIFYWSCSVNIYILYNFDKFKIVDLELITCTNALRIPLNKIIKMQMYLI